MDRLPWQLLSYSVLACLAVAELLLTIEWGKLRGGWVHGGGFLGNYALQITAMIQFIQQKVASRVGLFLSTRFNNWENLRTRSDYMDALIAKSVIHEIWNRFHVYFYMAFWKAKREGCVLRKEDYSTE